MASAPKTMASVVLLAIVLCSSPAFAIRKQNPGSSQNGTTSPIPNCPSSTNTPNFAVLDGTADCPSLPVPLTSRVFTLTDPTNTFSVTVTPALWSFEFSNTDAEGPQTILDVQFKNLTTSKNLVFKSFVAGTILNNSNYIQCQSIFPLNVNGMSFCSPGVLNVGNVTEVLEPTPITGADFSNTRWDFSKLKAGPGQLSDTLSLSAACIPQEFGPDYADFTGSLCTNTLSLPGGNGVATAFQAVASDGTVNYTAGTLVIRGYSKAENDVFSATEMGIQEFTDFLDTSLTNPGEILSGNGAGGEVNPQGDPPPTCGPDPTRVFRSVWYTFTPSPTDTRPVDITTAGSRYDTLLYVFTGPRSDPTPVACNDDTLFNPNLQSSDVTFTPVIGQQYNIMVSETPPDVGTDNDVPTAGPLANRATLFLNLNRVNPIPYIDSIDPVAVVPGTVISKLTIRGAGFGPDAKVNFNGVNLTPLTAAFNEITLANVAAPNYSTTLPLTVVNPNVNPRIGTSNAQFFPVTNPISSVNFSPSMIPIQDSMFTSPLVADVNQDGKMDALFVDLFAGAAVVALGNGDGTFQPAVSYTSDCCANWMAMGDFNGDGKLDLITVNGIDSSLSVMFGNGDGTFQVQPPISLTSPASFVTVGDFNGDGLLDLAIVIGGQTSTVSIMLGLGNGTFQPPSPVLTGDEPSYIVPGDFNGDGKLDLAVTTTIDTVSILLGNGDGTFQVPIVSQTGQLPLALATGDFNRDGVLDLAVANNSDGTVSVLLGKGDGSFQAHTDYQTEGAYSVATGDLNGDGKLDLVVANNTGFAFLLGNGDGTFQSANTNNNDPNTGFAAALGDFNNDGYLDVIVPNDFSDGFDLFLQQSTLRRSHVGSRHLP